MRAYSYCDFCDKSVRILQFETQLRDGEFDHQKDSAIFGIHNTSQTKVNSFSVCRHRQFLTSDDLNVRKFQ